MKKLNLATLILVSLGVTACSSGGSGSANQQERQSSAIEQQLKSENEQLKKAVLEAQKNAENAQNQGARLNAEIHSLNERIAEKEREISALKQANMAPSAETQADIEQKQQEIEALKTQLNQQKTQLSQQKAQLDKTNNALADSNSKLKVFEDEKAAQLAEKEKERAENEAQGKENAKWLEERHANFKRQMGNPKGQGTDHTGYLVKRGFRIVGSEQGHKQEWNNWGQEVPAVYQNDVRNKPLPSAEDSKGKYIAIGESRVYNQMFSEVYAERKDGRLLSGEKEDAGLTSNQRFNVLSVKGELTPEQAIPKTGVATYKGQSFGGFAVGDFSYTIDFANKTGSGKISNLQDVLNAADIVLEKGNIQANIIESSAHTENERNQFMQYPPLKGSYILGIYGPNAEEVAGKAELENIQVSRGMLRADGRSATNTLRSEFGFAGVKENK